MNLRQIEIIHAIVQYGSITLAARALHVSQPNVTRILAHAEQQLGFELFERSPQGLSPRPETLQLLPEIERLMQQRGVVDTLVTRLKQGESQQLRLGAAQALAQTTVPAMLPSLREALPGINIELMSGHWDTLCDALLRHQIEIALVFNQHPPVGIQTEVVARYPIMAVRPGHHSMPPTLGLDQLGHSPILMQPTDPLGRLLHAELDKQQIQLNSPWLIKSYTVIAEMAVTSGATGIVDAFTARHYGNSLQSAELSPSIIGEVALITLDHSPLSLAALTFATLLKKHLTA